MHKIDRKAAAVQHPSTVVPSGAPSTGPALDGSPVSSGAPAAAVLRRIAERPSLGVHIDKGTGKTVVITAVNDIDRTVEVLPLYGRRPQLLSWALAADILRRPYPGEPVLLPHDVDVAGQIAGHRPPETERPRGSMTVVAGVVLMLAACLLAVAIWVCKHLPKVEW